MEHSRFRSGLSFEIAKCRYTSMHFAPSKRSIVDFLFFSFVLLSFLLQSFLIATSVQAQNTPIKWSDALEQPPEWYGSAEAERIAHNVLLYQITNGGWPKNVDMAAMVDDGDREHILANRANPDHTHGQATIDNSATHTQLHYLARVYNQTGNDAFRLSFERGLDYLLQAQYDNGGWPQYYPLRDGYYSQVTFNDGAMIGVLEILDDIAHKKTPYGFVDQERINRSRAAIEKGIQLILKTQIRQNGRLTAWCAQHDRETLEPAWARAYEPPSLSGGETVGIIRYLMSIENPTPDIVNAIDGAIAWLNEVKIDGLRLERFTNATGEDDRRVIPDDEAPSLWARFYELETNRPIFLDRDSIFRYALHEIGQERRDGYAYYGRWPANLLEKEYPSWKLRIESQGALDGVRHRVVVSTDIGGTDPDDFQSMVHLLLYADVLDIEGLISSPYGPGRKAHILEVIDHYEKDFANLSAHSEHYPTPGQLRSITKQGAIDRAGYFGFANQTEGSEWIIERARVDDPRPLNLLVWGGLEDLAQALHDAPDILPRLRVYWIGGPNKKWSPDAYQYLSRNHPELWMIEANATYRGWFVGGNQADELGNSGFVLKNMTNQGALGSFFASQLGGTIKMGDTPSVAWLLKGQPNEPALDSWGGRFVRAWDRPFSLYDRMTTPGDTMQAFGILELALPLATNESENLEAWLEVDNQSLAGHTAEDNTIRFRFSPKEAREFSFTIKSNNSRLDGLKGGITAITPPYELSLNPSERYPNWWTDSLDPALIEEGHIGARSVNMWREEFLGDFAKRIARISTLK